MFQQYGQNLPHAAAVFADALSGDADRAFGMAPVAGSSCNQFVAFAKSLSRGG